MKLFGIKPPRFNYPDDKISASQVVYDTQKQMKKITVESELYKISGQFFSCQLNNSFFRTNRFFYLEDATKRKYFYGSIIEIDNQTQKDYTHAFRPIKENQFAKDHYYARSATKEEFLAFVNDIFLKPLEKQKTSPNVDCKKNNQINFSHHIWEALRDFSPPELENSSIQLKV
jgi:hypothetical protein